MEEIKLDRKLIERFIKNRYLTEWEQDMKRAIDSIITSEYELKKEAGDNSVIYYNGLPLDLGKRKVVYEQDYRVNRTLGILANLGLNIDEFRKTWMYNRDLTLLLGCVQDKIDGFDYDEYGLRVPNNQLFDLNNAVSDYDYGYLILKNDEVYYDFFVDEDGKIYVNGDDVMNFNNGKSI